jgi:aspartyl-tRNA synthetase
MQLVFNEAVSGECFAAAEELRPEYVIHVSGLVQQRENPNPNIPTGRIELMVDRLNILNSSKTPPIGVVKQEDVSEELRLRFRYIDLRRQKMRENIVMRHKIAGQVSRFLNDRGFLNIETPFLTKSTPEGARDFLVPSRLNRGKFYALPQSPQIFKQLLMVSGFERYYQIVKCFRDEDLRADRQPEFTQIDIEASFIDEDDIYELIDSMFASILENCYDSSLQTPVARMTYEEAMEHYGSDRPDMRIPFNLFDLAPFDLKPVEFVRKGLQEGMKLFGLILPQSEALSRKVLDGFGDRAKTSGVTLFSWLKLAGGNASGPMKKLFEQGVEAKLGALLEAGVGEPGVFGKRPLILLAAMGAKIPMLSFLGQIRSEIGKASIEDEKQRLSFCWVTDFPLFEWSEEEKRIVSVHHPFTAPKIDDPAALDADSLSIKSRSYDFVLNGIELGGGSIRIHDRSIQERIFSLLGLSSSQAKQKFGFLLEALQYGAPPHGGIAFGLDRIVMILQGEESIRDVIPFPKTASGTSPLSGAPDAVSKEQLADLGLRTIE